MKMLRFLSVLLLLVCLPLSVFAMDTGLVGNAFRWTYNADAVYVPIDPERFSGRLEDGFYQYYTDLPNSCFYFRISYTESSLGNSGSNDIYLHFNIENSSHNYSFRVDEYTDGKILDAFNVLVSFSGIAGSGQDIYVGIEFLNKEDKTLNNRLNVSLYVNGYMYYLCTGGNIELNYGDYYASQTTTKPSTTKPTTTETTTKPSTTKPTTTETTTKETTTKQTTTKPSTTKETTTKQTTTKPSTTKETTTEQTATTPSTTGETATKQTTTKRETTTKFKYTPTTGNETTTKKSTLEQTMGEKPTAYRFHGTQIGTGQTAANESTVTSGKPNTPTTEAATKFKYTETASSAASGEYPNGVDETYGASEFDDTVGEIAFDQIGQSGAIKTENGIILPEADRAERMSPQSKLLIAMAVIFAVGGIANIARNAKKENGSKEEE